MPGGHEAARLFYEGRAVTGVDSEQLDSSRPAPAARVRRAARPRRVGSAV